MEILLFSIILLAFAVAGIWVINRSKRSEPAVAEDLIEPPHHNGCMSHPPVKQGLPSWRRDRWISRELQAYVDQVYRRPKKRRRQWAQRY